MDIAALNEKITIQKNTVAVDVIGNRTSSWTDYFACHTTISGEDSVTGAEKETAGQIVDGTRINFTVRYCQTLAGINSKEYRVVFKNEFYNILTVNHQSYKHKSLKLLCEKVRR